MVISCGIFILPIGNMVNCRILVYDEEKCIGGKLMIQVLTYSGKDNDFKGDDIVVNSIHNPRSLDEFDINIISLAEEKCG